MSRPAEGDRSSSVAGTCNMKTRSISRSELEAARWCRLIEADGSRWEVLDLSVERDRVWIRGRLLSGDRRANPGGASGDVASGEEWTTGIRVFDAVLSRSTQLELKLPGGQVVHADGVETAGVEWSLVS